MLIGINFKQNLRNFYDIVVDISRPGEIDVIGGNVSSSVTLKTLKVDSQGKLIPTNNKSGDYPWFAVLANQT